MSVANGNRTQILATQQMLLAALLAVGASLIQIEAAEAGPPAKAAKPAEAAASKKQAEVAAAAKPATTPATTTYADKKNSYCIDFPSDWIVKSDPIVSMVAVPAALANEISAFPNVKIVAHSLPWGENVDSICNTSMKQWGSIWKVESDQHSSKGKTPTRRLVLMQLIPQANLRTKVLKAFAVSGDNYYIVSCADKPEHFEQSKKTFEAIIDSLKLDAK
ncbi:hypothetical protein BH11CYA1_BH11CYA1_23990 [soil metagenome]